MRKKMVKKDKNLINILREKNKTLKEIMKKEGFLYKTDEDLKEDLKKLIDIHKTCSLEGLSAIFVLFKHFGFKDVGLPHHNKLNKLKILIDIIEKTIFQDEGKKFNNNDIIKIIEENF